jgi:hypothetical protein
MMEVGPWRWDGDNNFNFKEGGWEEYTTMVYGKHTLRIYNLGSLPILSGSAGRNRLLLYKHRPVCA